MTVWHPILAATEPAPGVWIMLGPTEKRYGIIRLICIEGELGYRAVTWAERSQDRQVVGYFRSFRAATMAARMDFVSHHGVSGPVNGA
ncbi:hypothetical protein ACX3O0_01335 [Homoserinimonas sp. A447]